MKHPYAICSVSVYVPLNNLITRNGLPLMEECRPKTIKNACKGAKIGESLAVHGGSAPSSKEQVENWAEKCI